MAEWLAWRIELGKLDYNAVITKYPQFKSAIDAKLEKDGYIVNEDGTVTKK